MKRYIHKGTARGTITAPPSKSYAHRLILAAALSGEKCTVSHVELSEDIKATLECVKALGHSFTIKDGSVTFEPHSATSNGTGTIVMPCNESGTTLRFMIPVALALGGIFRFTGTPRLISRGISIYEDIFRQQGITCIRNLDSIEISGRLRPSRFSIDASISSQFISGLLFALPLVEGESSLRLEGRIESRMYIDMTLSILSISGIHCNTLADGSIIIPGNQTYTAVDARVEGDWSNAAFFSALNLMGGSVTIEGLKEDSLQGDRLCLEYFNALRTGTPQIDISNQIDLGPILFAMAAYLNGAVITGIRRLRIKESDRVGEMLEELSRLGADFAVDENRVVIRNAPLHKPSVTLKGHNDHRIVMALSILLTAFGGEIEGTEAVSKSYPSFFDVLKGTGIEITDYV